MLPNRPGFAASPPLARGDFEAEAPLIAELLGDGAHLVGHSYGAVIALYAAALRPEAVRSLTVSEPGCMRVAAGDPRVDAQIAAGELLYEHAQRLRAAGLPARVSRRRRLDARDAAAARRRAAAGRAAVHARTPSVGGATRRSQQLRAAPFSKLVISGGHSPVFEAVCDALAERLQARRADDRRTRPHDPGDRRAVQRPVGRLPLRSRGVSGIAHSPSGPVIAVLTGTEPAAFFAVTTARSVLPRPNPPSRKVGLVALAMLLQVPRRHSCHW